MVSIILSIKSFKNSSLENQDIPEGMYNMSLKPTSDELSYVYHEKGFKYFQSLREKNARMLPLQECFTKISDTNVSTMGFDAGTKTGLVT